MSGHRTFWLAFCAGTALNPDQKADLEQMTKRLASSRAWSFNEPRFVDEPPAAREDDDEEWVGVELELYSTFKPNKLPIDLERRQLEDTEAVIGAVWDWSDRNGVPFEAEYAGERIGAIENGFLDDGLGITFLEAWRRSLAARSRT